MAWKKHLAGTRRRANLGGSHAGVA